MLLKLPTLVLLYLWTVKEIMLILLPMKKQLEVILEENEDPSFVAVQDTLAETEYLKQENIVKTGAHKLNI